MQVMKVWPAICWISRTSWSSRMWASSWPMSLLVRPGSLQGLWTITDGPAVGQVEGGRRECAGLEPFQFFEASAVDEMVRRDDFDVQVLGELPDVELVVGAQAQLGPGTFSEPVCLGFESSSHVATCWPGRVRVRR